MMRFKNAAPILLALAGFAAVVPAQTIQINRDNKTIAINTSDEATETADIAAITVGFEIYGPDSQSVYADAGKLSQAILAALHKVGTEDKSIESAGQGLQRNTDFDDKTPPEERAQKQFAFQQSWTVSASPKNAAEVIRLAIAAGANKTGAIDWHLSDRKVLQARAATAALVKARAVAAQMAAGLNVKLGALIYASNETPNRPLFALNGRNFETVAVNAEAIAGPPPPPNLEIRPQTIREEATVYAVFAIE